MIEPGCGVFRAARGGVLAFACTLLASAAHLSGGGGVPPLGLTLALGGVLGGAFAVLAAGPARASRVVAVALTSQVGFHAAYALAGHAGPNPSARMVASHGVAAVGTALLAAHVDRLWWSAAALTAWARVPRVVVVPANDPVRPNPPAFDALVPSQRRESTTRPRRGPPAGLGSACPAGAT